MTPLCFAAFLHKLSIPRASLSSECLRLAALMLQYVRYSAQRHNKWKKCWLYSVDILC